jgi:hypothetical protein
MRVDLGPAAVDVLLVLAGFGVLNAVGFLRSSLVDVFAAIGLAFLAGVCFVMTIAIALLTIGVPFRLPAFIALSLATAVVGLLSRPGWLAMFRRRPILPRPRSTIRNTALQTRIAMWTVGVFGAYAVVGTLAARVQPLNAWDGWSIWTRKAEVLFFSGSLPTDFFASSAYAFMHPDYPILLPVFEAVQFRAMGTIDTQAIHVQFWLLLVAFVWATLYLGLRRGTILEWLPLALTVSIVPAVYGQLFTAYADIPMALLLALGVLLLGEWLLMRDGRMLALSVLFLIGSANTKNEGLMAAVVALAVAAVVTAVGPNRGRLRPLGLAAAAFVAGILPWRVWIAAQGIHGDIRLRDGLDPSYLAAHADRVWPSLQSLYAQLIDQASWLYVVPFAAAIAIVCLFVRQRRPLAAFYLVTGLLAFAALVWIYWISPTVPLDFFLASSSYRVVSVVTAIAFATLLQLAPPRDAQSLTDAPDAPPDRG